MSSRGSVKLMRNRRTAVQRATRPGARLALLRAVQATQARNVRVAQYARPNVTAARMQEHKTFDFNPGGVGVVLTADNTIAPAATPFAPIAGATGGCINQVPLGNSSITRVGRKLNITAVAIRGEVLAGSTTLATKATMLLIWDRNVNQSAALPPWAQILNAQNPNSLTNKDNAPRFKILRRWDFEILGNRTAGQITEKGLVKIEEFIKLKNKVTIFTTADSTGIYPDMMEGGLLLYVTSDNAGTAAPQFVLNTRIYFQDS